MKEKRKKKQEAKREAASKMLEKIKELQKEETNLTESLNGKIAIFFFFFKWSLELPTTKKTKEDRTMKLFNKSLKPFILKKIPKPEAFSLELIQVIITKISFT